MNSFSYPQGQVYGNYGYGNYGYNYQAQQPKIPTMNQLMSDDERKLIESRGSGLVLEFTDVDRARAKCTHKNSQSLTVTPKYPNDPNSNLWECSQCHKVFEIKDWSESEVVDLVIEMMNVIDNIKLFIPYIAPDVGTALYSSYDLIETIPRLYRYMLDYKKKMWSAIDASRNPMQANGSMNTLNVYNALHTGMGMGMGPGYVPPISPMSYQQPMGAPMGVYPPQPPMAPNPMMPPQQPQPMGAPMPTGGYQQVPPQQPVMPMGYPTPGAFQPGMMADRPIGQVDPVAVQQQPQPMQGYGMPVQAPQQQAVVQQQQTATAGPAPLPQTQPNVPPASAPVNTSDVIKSFKA